MTNLSDSSPIKLLIIHGLNNNLEGFYPLRDACRDMGFETHLITLPGHGEDRNEAKSFKLAFGAFSESMEKHTDSPYQVIAFSQGALFLQLWMQTNPKMKPLSQILLAPALFINRQSLIEKVISLLPSFVFIVSQTPEKVRRYPKLYIWEYRTLFEAVKRFQGAKAAFPVPTLVMIDPQDELINATLLESTLKSWNTSNFEFQLIHRPVISAPGLGKHHVIFHPDYYGPGMWFDFVGKIKRFLSAGA
jgi:esterase/lipase